MGEVSISSGEGEARLHTGMGNVLVGEGTLDLDAFTGMGELRLARLGGQAKLRTGMGLIEVVEARNLRVDANSGKGDVRLAGYFGPIQAKVGDGQIRCFLGELAAPVELTTGRGSIDVAFSARQAVRVDASTSRGRIDSEVPLVQVGQPGPEGFFNKRVVGTVGSGEIQATLRLRSGFGNVRLRLLDTGETPSAQPAPGTVEAGEAEQKVAVAAGASGSSWTSPDAPASDQPPRRTRLDVLQALGRGEITIDEAERLLATSA
jgi:Putative adhesin